MKFNAVNVLFCDAEFVTIRNEIDKKSPVR